MWHISGHKPLNIKDAPAPCQTRSAPGFSHPRATDLPVADRPGRLWRNSEAGPPVNPILLSCVIAAVAVIVFVVWGRRSRHQRAVRDILDAADALEARLRMARDEIEAVAGSQAGDPVQDAMKEMLRQRLWLRDHGEAASLAQLQDVRDGIETARERIDRQLDRIEEARAPTV